MRLNHCMTGALNQNLVKNRVQGQAKSSKYEQHEVRLLGWEQDAKKCVFNCLRKMEYVSAVHTSAGREFQRYGATTYSAREPALVLEERGRISSLLPEARALCFSYNYNNSRR